MTHKVRWYALQCVLMRLALCLGAPMDSDRFERTNTHRLRRQDMCCTGTDFVLAHTTPSLIRLRLNGSCSARPTIPAAIQHRRAMSKRHQNGLNRYRILRFRVNAVEEAKIERPPQCWGFPIGFTPGGSPQPSNSLARRSEGGG